MRFVRLVRMGGDEPAEAARRLGWSEAELDGYEKGTREIHIAHLFSFLVRFGVSADFLILNARHGLDETLKAYLASQGPLEALMREPPSGKGGGTDNGREPDTDT